MLTILILVLLISFFIFGCAVRSKMGKAPSGDRLTKIKLSSHYHQGAFVNLMPTPEIKKGDISFPMMVKLFSGRFPGSRPTEKIQALPINLHSLPKDQDVLVWFGHSSYFIQIQGIKILVDPVLSGHASPVPGLVRAFDGTDIYSAKDIPEIDYLLITHDHYDHLDANTVKAIQTKVRKLICGLGVGSHLESWAYPKDKIIEKDWGEKLKLAEGLELTVLSARHFSGRGLKRNNTLWVSFLLEARNKKIFMGGDGGYDSHFADIGAQYGPIDLAILENGQYNKAWHAIHCMPEETLMAAQDLKATYLMPVHSGKFSISTHTWDEPLKELSRLNENVRIPLVTPMIGELIQLDSLDRAYTPWWNTIK